MKKHFIFVNPLMVPYKLAPNLTKNMSPNECLDEIEERVSFPILLAIKNKVEPGEKIQITTIKAEGNIWKDVNYNTFKEELEAIRYGFDLYDLYDEYFSNRIVEDLKKGINKKESQDWLVSDESRDKLESMDKSRKLTADGLQHFIKRYRKEGKEKPFKDWLENKMNEIKDKSTPKFDYEEDEIVIDNNEKPDTLIKLWFAIIHQLEKLNDEYLYADISFGSKAAVIVFVIALTYLYRNGDGLIPKMISYGHFLYDDSKEAKNNPQIKRSLTYDVSTLLYLNSTYMNVDKIGSENQIELLEKLWLEDED